MPSFERRATTVGLGGLALFQLGLAAGAPWGRASYGGSHRGVLPNHLRLVSAGAAVLYTGLAAVVASPRTPTPRRRRALTAITGAMGIGTVVNGLSPSWPERAIWTPASAALAALAWRARTDRSRSGRAAAPPGRPTR